jgi:hypothetical protein
MMNLQSLAPRWLRHPMLRRVRQTPNVRESTCRAEVEVTFRELKLSQRGARVTQPKSALK